MGDSGAMNSSNVTDVRASVVICPNCNHMDLVGFPAGVKFAPSDQELIEHLESMVLVKEGGSRANAIINYFIPTVGGDIGICYTHPENLPGMTKDGRGKHFFHRTSKAYRSGTRTRRKVMSEHGQHSSEDVGEAHWHQTGNTHPVIVGGRQKGWKKILVLHNVKPGKREMTNWIMYQYHLGMSDQEKDGELVLSKVFYRCPDARIIEQDDEKVDQVEASEATPNVLVSGAVDVVTAARGTMVQQLPPKKMFQEAGVGDPVSGDDQGQVDGNNHHIPLQLPVQSVHMELDTTLSVQDGIGEPVSGDQGEAHGNNHHIPSQHHVQSVDSEPDTTLSLGLGTGC